MSKKKKANVEKDPTRSKGVQKSESGGSAKLTTGFDRLENWLVLHQKRIFYLFCFLTTLFSLLLFNFRISEGGDDSSYIYAGSKYSKDFFNYFYSNNAPLYPLFLSLPIKLFGINVVLLKLVSSVLYFFSFLFLYKAFKDRIPFFILMPAMLFYSLDHYLQYYSSQTYNEAFFLFFQSLFIFYFFKLLDHIRENDSFRSIKEDWRYWIAIGFLAAAVSLIKNLGVMIFPLVIVYFLIQKQWKQSLIAAVSMLGIRFSFDIVKNIIWGSVSQFAAQSKTLLYKDPYDPLQGTEDLLGMMHRFWINCVGFLSNRIPQIFGFREEIWQGYSVVLTITIIFLFVLGLFYVIKSKNIFFLFTWIYVGGMVFTSFVVLQNTWAQARMIVIHVPLLLLIIGFAIYKIVDRYKVGYVLFILVFFVLTASVFISSVKKSSSNITILKKNLKGDIYYGYTPDWINLLKMSRWCADSLDPNVVVASRKSAMSFIYGNGREFFPINRTLFYDTIKKECNPDSVLLFCMKNKIKYFIMPSLRYIPDKKTERTIDTIDLMFSPLATQRKGVIVFVRREGAKNEEPCYLFEIKY